MHGDCRRLAAAMICAVTFGQISVPWNGREHTLRAGMTQTFGGERDERFKLPSAVRGFSGQVQGVVVERGEKHSFIFRVDKVLKTWKGNKAKRGNDLKGQTVRVGPGWAKADNGRWHPVERHVTFVDTLKPRQELTLEIANHEGDHFAILELSKDQREMAGDVHEGDKEGEKDGDKDGEEDGADKGETRGILIHKDKNWVEVKSNQGKTRRYFAHDSKGRSDSAMESIFKELIVTNIVSLKWKGRKEPRVTTIKIVSPKHKKGTVVGSLVFKNGSTIDVKPDGDGDTERYIPRWVGGMPNEGGGPEKDVARAIFPLRVGDKVKLDWIYDERKRVVAIQRLGGEDDGENRAEHHEQKKKENGKDHNYHEEPAKKHSKGGEREKQLNDNELMDELKKALQTD